MNIEYPWMKNQVTQRKGQTANATMERLLIGIGDNEGMSNFDRNVEDQFVSKIK